MKFSEHINISYSRKAVKLENGCSCAGGDLISVSVVLTLQWTNLKELLENCRYCLFSNSNRHNVL